MPTTTLPRSKVQALSHCQGRGGGVRSRIRYARRRLRQKQGVLRRNVVPEGVVHRCPTRRRVSFGSRLRSGQIDGAACERAQKKGNMFKGERSRWQYYRVGSEGAPSEDTPAEGTKKRVLREQGRGVGVSAGKKKTAQSFVGGVTHTYREILMAHQPAPSQNTGTCVIDSQVPEYARNEHSLDYIHYSREPTKQFKVLPSKNWNKKQFYEVQTTYFEGEVFCLRTLHVRTLV